MIKKLMEAFHYRDENHLLQDTEADDSPPVICVSCGYTEWETPRKTNCPECNQQTLRDAKELINDQSKIQ
jgi:rubrerythrin